MTPAQGAQRLRRVARQVRKTGEEVTREVARTLARELIAKTPIDTGRAMSNWAVAFDRKPLFYRFTAYVPGEKGSTEPANFAAAYGAAEAIINRFDATKYKKIWIANYTPYMKFLAAGTSPQALEGWVQRIYAKAAAAGRAKVLKVYISG